MGGFTSHPRNQNLRKKMNNWNTGSVFEISANLYKFKDVDNKPSWVNVPTKFKITLMAVDLESALALVKEYGKTMAFLEYETTRPSEVKITDVRCLLEGITYKSI